MGLHIYRLESSIKPFLICFETFSESISTSSTTTTFVHCLIYISSMGHILSSFFFLRGTKTNQRFSLNFRFKKKNKQTNYISFISFMFRLLWESCWVCCSVSPESRVSIIYTFRFQVRGVWVHIFFPFLYVKNINLCFDWGRLCSLLETKPVWILLISVFDEQQKYWATRTCLLIRWVSWRIST